MLTYDFQRWICLGSSCLGSCLGSMGQENIDAAGDVLLGFLLTRLCHESQRSVNLPYPVLQRPIWLSRRQQRQCCIGRYLV